MSNIASILIDALKDKLTPSDQTSLLTGFADLESASLETIVTRNRVVMGSLILGTQDGFTITHPSGARSIVLEPIGSAFFGSDIDDPAKTSLAIFSEPEKYNSEDLGAGDLLIGDNSSGKANMLWDVSTGRLNFRGGVNTYVYIDTDGSIVAALGEIGGWNIGATKIYDDGSTIVLDSANQKITVGTGTQIVIDGAGEIIKSSNFSASALGWQIDSVGDAEFNNIYARGKMSAVTYEYDNVSAVGGKSLYSKNASVVWTNFTTPASISGSGALYMENQNQGTTAVAAVDDIIHIRIFRAGSHTEMYGTITSVGSDLGGYRLYGYTLEAGDTSQYFEAGTPVVNLGPSGYGVLSLEAGSVTRMRIADHAGSPWTTLTNKVVLGNMRNTYDTGANDRYGIGIGDFSSGNYLSYNAETANAFKVKAGGGVLSIDASGIRIAVSAANEGIRSYQFTDSSGNLIIALGGWQTGGQTKSALIVSGDATFPAALMSIVSQPDTGGLAQLALRAGNSYINLDHSGAGATSMTFFGDDYRFIEETVGGGQFTVEGAVTLGNSVPQHSVAGDTWVMNDQRIGGGLYVGSTGTDPDADNITADGDIHAGADLSATGDIRTVAWTDYSATSTITGWTTYTNKQIWYKKIGKLMHVQFAVQGVSNATSTSFTLPYANNANVRSYGVHRIYNNNVAAFGIHQMTESASLVSFYTTPAAGAWTASGNKYIFGHFVYQTT